MTNSLASVRVLLTGGTGFIGSHLARRLVHEGAAVYLLVRPDSRLDRLTDVAGRLRLLYGDLRDRDAVQQALRAARPELLFHLAANTDVRRLDSRLTQLDESIETNLKGTLNLVTAVCRMGSSLRCFVRTGGLEEYGNGPVPYDEQQRECPVSPYSASQVAATHYCHMLHEAAGLPVVTLRPALTYGPAQSTAFFLPALISHCLIRRDFVMRAGDQVRDLIHVRDVVEAYVRAAARPRAIGQVINVGSGVEQRMGDVAEAILGMMNHPIRVVPEPAARPAGVQRLCCGREKAARLLDWRPQVVLEDGLRETIDWYREHTEVQGHECISGRPARRRPAA